MSSIQTGSYHSPAARRHYPESYQSDDWTNDESSEIDIDTPTATSASTNNNRDGPEQRQLTSDWSISVAETETQQSDAFTVADEVENLAARMAEKIAKKTLDMNAKKMKALEDRLMELISERVIGINSLKIEDLEDRLMQRLDFALDRTEDDYFASDGSSMVRSSWVQRVKAKLDSKKAENKPVSENNPVTNTEIGKSMKQTIGVPRKGLQPTTVPPKADIDFQAPLIGYFAPALAGQSSWRLTYAEIGYPVFHDVHMFTEQARAKAASLGDDKICRHLHQCLLGEAWDWYRNQLSDTERETLASGLSLELWIDTLVRYFDNALGDNWEQRVNAMKFTVEDVIKGRSVMTYLTEMTRLLKKVLPHNDLDQGWVRAYEGLDYELRMDLKMSIWKTTEEDEFTKKLLAQEQIWIKRYASAAPDTRAPLPGVRADIEGQRPHIEALSCAQLRELEGQIKDLQKEVKAYQDQAEEIRARADLVQEGNEDLQDSHDVLQLDYDDLEKEKLSLAQEHEELKAEYASVKRNYALLKGEYHALARDNCDQPSERQAVQDKYDALQVEHGTLEKKHEALEQAQEAKQVHHEAIQKHHDSFFSSFRSHVNSLENQKSTLQIRAEVSEQQVRQLQQEAQRSQRMIDSLQSALLSRSNQQAGTVAAGDRPLQPTPVVQQASQQTHHSAQLSQLNSMAQLEIAFRKRQAQLAEADLLSQATQRDQAAQSSQLPSQASQTAQPFQPSPASHSSHAAFIAHEAQRIQAYRRFQAAQAASAYPRMDHLSQAALPPLQAASAIPQTTNTPSEAPGSAQPIPAQPITIENAATGHPFRFRFQDGYQDPNISSPSSSLSPGLSSQTEIPNDIFQAFPKPKAESGNGNGNTSTGTGSGTSASNADNSTIDHPTADNKPENKSKRRDDAGFRDGGSNNNNNNNNNNAAKDDGKFEDGSWGGGDVGSSW
ncbi:MAG: hypothetical protein M1819_000177 [Sarea resinae]|nr:MAG: hypothetical protein M1819_000177 [Sarea resinae]